MKILHSKIIGSGNNHIVILHGLLGMGDNWKSVANKLSSDDSYCIHLIDQRNHGKSFHSNKINYVLMVDDLHNYLDHHGIHKCLLIGHSMGGKTAMIFSMLHSRYLNKLVIVDIAPKKYEPKFNYLFLALKALNLGKYSSRKEIEIELAKTVSEQSLVFFLLKNIGRDSNNNFFFKSNVNVLHQNLIILMDKLTISHKIFVDTFFVKGDKSDYIIESDVIFVKDKFPNSEIISIPNSGHWVHAENPDYFHAILLQILKN
ncbi:alpha/beta fold hydrolase [Flavobacteriaceae bacterium]|jgi:pimeloyl-ACP methyl ester carboxylesterase|nr:alpha/beta fold hydrolase [bacterium]MDA9067889.1 alpha/beta fold hydrolase [Flavobacteriaceae bacterium]MDA9285019.1 alpha/beta fold hydrolase [Flavobacteriaceae bacterium]MDC1320501.1 alpha/beta fold hydrolase [Flavobacteriaceae bacterium]